MSRCGEELCRNWTGSGRACEVLDLEPDIVCGHGGGFGCDECTEPEAVSDDRP